MKHFIRFWKKSLLGKIFESEKSKEKTFFILALFTGLSAGLIAVFVHKTTHIVIEFFGTDKPFSIKSLLLGGFSISAATYIIYKFCPSSSGSGIPGVRIALTAFRGKIPFRDTLAKFFTTIMSLASGFSLGLEGPIVSISSGIGSFIGEFTAMPTKKVKALLATGSAAGIAAAFNTPIAAVVFTLEEIVGDLNATKILGPIIISSVVAAVTATALNGDYSTFGNLYYKLNDSRELILYLFVGVLAALLGSLWVKFVLKLRSFQKDKFKGKEVLFSLAIFSLIALLSHINVDILGSGNNTIQRILHSLITNWEVLLTLLILKFIVTALCYSTGVSGGLFLPILLMGASTGGLVGALALKVFPSIDQSVGAFALVGMGAFFAAVIRSPFTSIIMIFEMTRDYNIILPLMVANIISLIISSRFLRGSIYEYISEQDGVHLPTLGEDHEVLDNLIVEDAMINSPFCLNSDLQVKMALRKVDQLPYSGYPILNKGRLLGMVSKKDIQTHFAKGNGHVSLEDMCRKTVIKVYPDQSLLMAFHKLKKYHVSRLPIVSRVNDKEIVGIITAEDIVNQFGYHIKEKEENQIKSP